MIEISEAAIVPGTGLDLLWLTLMRWLLGEDRTPWPGCRCCWPPITLASVPIGWPGGSPVTGNLAPDKSAPPWPPPWPAAPSGTLPLAVVVVAVEVGVRDRETPPAEWFRLLTGVEVSWLMWLVRDECGWDWLREELGDWLWDWAWAGLPPRLIDDWLRDWFKLWLLP